MKDKVKKYNNFYLEKGDTIQYYRADTICRLASMSYHNGGMSLEEAVNEISNNIYQDTLEFVEYKKHRYYFYAYINDCCFRTIICYTEKELIELYRINKNKDIWLRWYKINFLQNKKLKK